MVRNRTTRRSVVGDDVTKEVLQLGAMHLDMANNDTRVNIFVRLLDEGTEVFRPTEALDLGNGLFKVLPTGDYDPDDETWEFPPGSVVRCEKSQDREGEYLRAVKP